MKVNKIPIKKVPSKVTKTIVNPTIFIDDYRDPAGRVPAKKEEEFKLPVPGTITSLRRFLPKPQGHKQQREIKSDKPDRLSDYL